MSPVLQRWAPTEGPQTEALRTKADILFYGGSAGGGKTDLLIGATLTQHDRSIIYRRDSTQLQAIIDRYFEILKTRDGFNAQTNIWRLEDRQIELGSCFRPGDEISYQGRPHDLKGFDEITHFLEEQFKFLIGWCRSTVVGQRTRVICTGNPPSKAKGDWVIKYWAPWLDDKYPNPAEPGELRWFAMIDGEDTEVESGDLIQHKGEEIYPKSRTFIPSAVDDNPFLIRTGYKAMLQALPEPLRSQMLLGDFKAGHEDDAWQVIPSDWVQAAQDRWKSEHPGPMSAMGVDVARGGRDETILSPRHNLWFAEQVIVPGKATPDGPAVSGLVVANLRDEATIHIDVIGVGSSPYDHLKESGLKVFAMQSSERTEEHDRTGKLKFKNKRSLWWWRMREALDPVHGEPICLPPDRKLRADLTAPYWKVLAGGVIQVEGKEDIIKRLGRSPDRGDAAVYALPDYAVPRTDEIDWDEPVSWEAW